MTLSFEKTKQLLSKYKIPTVREAVISNTSEAFNFVRQNGYPVVLKIFSPKILHKTETGGVILNIQNKKLLLDAWKKISKIAKKEKANIVIQKQEQGIQIIMGAKRDPVFGPIVMFGLGGIFTEVLKDVSFRLAPINKKEAEEMIKEIKGYKILIGYRNQKKINILSIEKTLFNLSNLIVKEKEVREVDFNPVMANDKRIVIVDAKILIN